MNNKRKTSVNQITFKCHTCDNLITCTEKKFNAGKKYCSTKCQHQSYKKEKVNRIEIECPNCKNNFKSTENKIQTGKSKFCSRKCKDEFQKQKYKGDGNPMYGKEISIKHKLILSDFCKERWQDKDFREYFKLKAEEYYKSNGFHYGTDENSNKKRKNSFLNNYGVDHDWKVPEIRQKCEDTTIRLYGDTSLNLARQKLIGQGTKIEKIIEEILINNNIKFKKQFRLYINDLEYRTYDFYIVDKNILIEADGDFWHANPIYYQKNKLHEIQKINIKNDKLKNELAINLNYILIRFWETEIKNINFEQILLQKLK